MMQYCSQHQLALMQRKYNPLTRQMEPECWDTFPYGRLLYALAWARAWGCEKQIDVHETPCPQCQQQEDRPMEQTMCDRCQKITTVTAQADGFLRLCAACALNPTPCAPFEHAWHGSRERGVFVCVRCGARLTSQPIDPDKVVQAPSADFDC